MLWVFLPMILVMSACNIWVVESTEANVYSDLRLLPDHRIALVLGTSHRSVGGGPNPFFQNRIEMAATLYSMGKIDHFILSGDNSTKYYNEPMEMKKALIKKGVPLDDIPPNWKDHISVIIGKKHKTLPIIIEVSDDRNEQEIQSGLLGGG